MVSIGMKLSPAVFSGTWALAFSLVLALVAILTKYGAASWILRGRADLNPPLIAWGLVPRGIPGFAFASVAVSHGLIGDELFTILILVVSVTTWIGLAALEFVGRAKL
jgi:Kef-type K+ transport system membrane component KefB